MKKWLQHNPKKVLIAVGILLTVAYIFTMVDAFKTTKKGIGFRLQPVTESIGRQAVGTLQEVDNLLDASSDLSAFHRLEKEFYQIAQKENMTTEDTMRLIGLYQKIKDFHNAR